jgi:nitrite reductase (NO-forming)
MKPRSIAELYQSAARLWMTAALLSFLLPASARLGLWLPVHLALLGAAGLAICGAMQTFVLSMTATRSPSDAEVTWQFLLANLGVSLIAVGYPASVEWLVALGGASFVASILVLARIVWRAWKRALNKRHVIPVAIYKAAILCLLIGGVLGALVGARAVTGTAWVGMRSAHLTLNVLGWTSLTIVGTLITLLPTVLRVRMPEWRGRATAALLISGVAILALGLASDAAVVASAGAVLYALGAIGAAGMVAKVLRTPRKWPPPVSAKHLLAAFVWFVCGTIALAAQVVRGEFAAFRMEFLIVFAAGWIVQTLLGAWMFLLPMWRAGHPEQRRRNWAAVEFGGTLQILAYNVGLLVVAMRWATADPGPVGEVGLWLWLAAVTVMLAKAWAFPLLARGPVETPHARRMWWADEE